MIEFMPEFMPELKKNLAIRLSPPAPTAERSVRDAVIAVNMETMTPRQKTRAKPFITGVEAK